MYLSGLQSESTIMMQNTMCRVLYRSKESLADIPRISNLPSPVSPSLRTFLEHLRGGRRLVSSGKRTCAFLGHDFFSFSVSFFIRSPTNGALLRDRALTRVGENVMMLQGRSHDGQAWSDYSPFLSRVHVAKVSRQTNLLHI